MTQQPYYPPPQGQPQQAYPPQPMAPAPVPQQPQYAPAYPPQQVVAPQYPGYPPQAYIAPPAQPAVPLAQGSIDDYYSQPSTGGGAGLKFTGPNNQPLIGQSYVVQVARPITAGDVQQQTDQTNKPLFWKDGRPKFVLIVPVQLLEPSPNHPDGLAKWYVKGAARDELVRAMAEAGAPEGPPEYGACIRVTLTGTRRSGPGMNPAHVFAVQYIRPAGAAPVPVPAATSPVAGIPEQIQQPAQPPVTYPPVQQTVQVAPAAYEQPIQPGVYAPSDPALQQYPAQPPAAAPVQVAQAPAPQPPANLTPEQAELLARMTA